MVQAPWWSLVVIVPLYVACPVHAIHLVACDVLCKSQESRSGEDNREDEEIEQFDFQEEENNDFDFDEESTEDKLPKFVPELKEIIVKVRKIVKVFRKSPVRNDANLQPQNMETFGKQKNLLLDCKTRWNSLLKMLQRLYEVKKGVKIAMLQIDQQFDLNDEELATIEQLCDAFAPLEVAVQYLCQEDADLVIYEKVVSFTLKKLRDLNTTTGKTVFQNLKFDS